MKKLLCVLMFGLVFGQTEWTTRVYSFEYNLNANEEFPFDIESITGYPLEYAIIHFIDIESNYNSLVIDFQCTNMGGNTFVNLSGSEPNSTFAGQNGSHLYHNDRNCKLVNISPNWHQSTLTLSITAEFPIEDTGYIEEGFDYCIDVGANLVASPCRDEIDIIDTLPSEIQNNLTSIVGQGVAANNQDGVWVGSLNGLGGGDGYWFISNASACFNYNCAEN